MALTQSLDEYAHINDLYRTYLGRDASPEDLRNYASEFGSSIEPSEIEAFIRGGVTSGEITQARADALLASTQASTQAGTQDDFATRKANIRNELQNQYDNLVAYDNKLAYRGRSSDLDKIFNQQADQLANAGVSSVGNLRVRAGQLVDISQTNGPINFKVIDTTGLKGSVSRDRDTGAMKWGDIFSGVEGGANYGISTTQDGSVILYPVYEKTKSPIAQIGLGGLEGIITPLLSIAGAAIGAGPTGSVIGAALGSGAGSTAGQLLASGKVDWEQVAKSAALAGAGAGISKAITGAEAAPIAEPGTTLATSTPVPGSFQAALPDLGVQTAATTPGATLLPGSFQAALPSLIAPVNVMGDTAQGLLNQDLQFVGEDAAQLYAQTGDVAAVQQNLIAAGVDPIMAAEASNLAALGGTGSSIARGLGSAFPGEAIFTSQGLLGGGATMDEFAKDIAGISSTSGSALPNISITDALKGASLANQLISGGQQQTATGFPQQQASFRPTGVDYSGIYGLLGQRASVPGIASLLGPAQLRSLLG